MYHVIPFQASISHEGSPQEVAAGMQRIIDDLTAAGWEFVQVQELTTFVAGNMGCFGLGATPGRNISMAVLIFKK